MNVQILLDGNSVVKADVDLSIIQKLLAGVAITPAAIAQSTPATAKQMEDLLSRIDQKSVHFLRSIAVDPSGSLTFKEMRKIFGLGTDDWNGYSMSYGKGITRAFRHVLGGHKSAKLIWWNDQDWEAAATMDDDACKVFIDGAALAALREVI